MPWQSALISEISFVKRVLRSGQPWKEIFQKEAYQAVIAIRARHCVSWLDRIMAASVAVLCRAGQSRTFTCGNVTYWSESSLKAWRRLTHIEIIIVAGVLSKCPAKSAHLIWIDSVSAAALESIKAIDMNAMVQVWNV